MDVPKKVIDIIAEVFKKSPQELTYSTSFVNDLHAKSIQIIETIALMEDEFNIKIPFHEARKNRTIGDVIKYIEGKLETSRSR